jgi:hypothetical protein
MRVTQDFNSFGEIIAHAQCSVDEKKSAFERIFNVMQYPTRISFALLYWKTELSAVQYFAICS